LKDKETTKMKKNNRGFIFSAALAIATGWMLGAAVSSCMSYDGPELIGIHAEAAAVSDISDNSLSKYEKRLIARIVYVEAGDESEYGQRLVIDTVLNRVDSNNFPDNVYDVIYQPNQFYTKTLPDAPIEKDILKLVNEELEERTNSEVAFFNAVGYTKYGVNLFKEGGHYFSKEKE
jgi:N-acetylmuramoyl-L-alanine amidase